MGEACTNGLISGSTAYEATGARRESATKIVMRMLGVLNLAFQPRVTTSFTPQIDIFCRVQKEITNGTNA
jgi:hypothetical protein